MVWILQHGFIDENAHTVLETVLPFPSHYVLQSTIYKSSHYQYPGGACLSVEFSSVDLAQHGSLGSTLSHTLQRNDSLKRNAATLWYPPEGVPILKETAHGFWALWASEWPGKTKTLLSGFFFCLWTILKPGEAACRHFSRLQKALQRELSTALVPFRGRKGPKIVDVSPRNLVSVGCFLACT